MKFTADWLRSPWKKQSPSYVQSLYVSVFDNVIGHELLEFWMDNIVMRNPQSADPQEALIWATRCMFVEDIVKALDRARSPDKYKPTEIRKEDSWQKQR